MDVVVSESAPYEGSSSPSCALFDQINFFLSILSALEACEKPNAEDLQRLLTMLPSNHLYSTHEKYPFLQSYIQSSKYEPSPSESLPHFLHQFKDYPSFLSAIAVNDQSSQLFEMTPEMTQLARQELTRVQPVAPCQTKMSLPMSLDELVKRCLQRSEDAPTFESQVTSILSSEEAPLEHSNLEPFSGGGGPKIENGFQPRIGCEQHTSYALDLGANVVRYLGEQCRKCVSSDPKIFNMRLRLAAVMQSFKVHHSFVLKTWQLRRRREMYLASKTARSAQVIAQRKVALKEREHREYIQALKAQDMDKYLEYVKSSKNSRIQELLRQTDFYLESIQKRMRIQQKATVDLVATQQQGESTTSDKAKPTRASKRLSKRQSSASVVEAVPVQATNVHQINKGISVETLKQPKLLVGGQLMPYQLIGVQFLVNLFEANLSGILADEMGLGKTVQTIAFLAHLAETKFVRGPHLIVVPLSTLPIWALEFNRWCPSFKVMEFRGSRPERREFASAIRHLDFDICLTTYDWILREKTVLSMPHWCCIIVDEGHRMKNIKSKFHVTLSEFQSTCRLLLTGTPLQNNLVELWALLNFLLPKIFTSSTDFEEWFEKPFKDMPGHEPIELTDDEKFLIINRLHSVLRPFLLRRIKEEVLEDLPEKREYVIRIQLSAWQKAVYDQISSKALRWVQHVTPSFTTAEAELGLVVDANIVVFRSETVDGKVTHRSYANTVVQLRKIVNHPYLFESEYFLNEDLYRVSGKFEVLDRSANQMLPVDQGGDQDVAKTTAFSPQDFDFLSNDPAHGHFGRLPWISSIPAVPS